MQSRPATPRDVLVLHNSYRPARLDADTIALSAKYLEVLQAWADCWPGHVQNLLETTPERSLDMTVELSVDDLPVGATAFERSTLRAEHFPEGAMVAAVLEAGLRGLHRHVTDSPLRVVRGSDLPPNVLFDVAKLARPGRLRAAKRWPVFQRERLLQIRELRHAAALQSNQFATIDYYERWIDDRLAFIDTRLQPGDAASDTDMDARRSRYRRGEPLHLCFSGRLDPMKSPLDIVEIADALRAMGVPFRYSVFGDGELRDRLTAELGRAELGELVTLRGFVDLRTELLPALGDVDVYVGNHRQGDTSTTYPEMMAMGVPVVSYPNDAVRALHRRFGVATLAESVDPRALARAIALLAGDREELCAAATRDHGWARDKTLTLAYRTRVQHLLGLRERYHAALDRR